MDERNDGEKTRVISANASSFSDTISHELEQKRAVGFNGPFLLYKPLFTPQNRCFIEDFT
jgi:hypothetical protein